MKKKLMLLSLLVMNTSYGFMVMEVPGSTLTIWVNGVATAAEASGKKGIFKVYSQGNHHLELHCTR